MPDTLPTAALLNPPTMPPDQEAFTWMAEYEDGETVFQNDEHGRSVRGIKDVDLGRVKSFSLLPLLPGLPSPTVWIDQRAGQRLIYTTRTSIAASQQGVEHGRRKAWLLGWQQTVSLPGGDRNVKSVAYCFSDGSILLSSDDQLTPL